MYALDQSLAAWKRFVKRLHDDAWCRQVPLGWMIFDGIRNYQGAGVAVVAAVRLP